MLSENDFDFGNEISLVDINGDVEPVEAEIITDADQFEKMSLSLQKKNKEALANLKSRVMISLDERKLVEAQKILKGLENLGDIFSDAKILEAVKKNVSSAQDIKFLADAYSKLLESQRNLMRLDSVDAVGNAKKFSIGVRYKDDSGTKVETVVKVGD